MNGVLPSWRASRRRESASARGSVKAWLPASGLGCRGGAWSVRSSSGAGSASRWVRQYARSVSRRSPVSHWRCQIAKSAYWRGGSGSGESAARRVGSIEDVDLARDEPERPAVRHDVVNRDDELVLVGSQADQDGTEQRAAGQAERPPHFPLYVLLHHRLPVRRRHVLQVDDLRRQRSRAGDVLPRLTVPRHEGRPQRLVTAGELGECARERGSFEWAPESPAHRDRIGGGPGLELVEEPEPLLDEGERRVSVPRDGGGSRLRRIPALPEKREELRLQARQLFLKGGSEHAFRSAAAQSPTFDGDLHVEGAQALQQQRCVGHSSISSRSSPAPCASSSTRAANAAMVRVSNNVRRGTSTPRR